MYVKLLDRVVWDKKTRVDDIFGSTGSGITLDKVVDELKERIEARSADLPGTSGGKASKSKSARQPGKERATR